MRTIWGPPQFFRPVCWLLTLGFGVIVGGEGVREMSLESCRRARGLPNGLIYFQHIHKAGGTNICNLAGINGEKVVDPEACLVVLLPS